MKTQIQFVKIERDPVVEAFVVKKLNKLYKRYDWIHNANVFLKTEKKSAGKGKICEIRLNVPGQLLFAASDEDSFEKATDETIHDLEIQLKERKGEMKPHM